MDLFDPYLSYVVADRLTVGDILFWSVCITIGITYLVSDVEINGQKLTVVQKIITSPVVIGFVSIGVTMILAIGVPLLIIGVFLTIALVLAAPFCYVIEEF